MVWSAKSHVSALETRKHAATAPLLKSACNIRQPAAERSQLTRLTGSCHDFGCSAQLSSGTVSSLGEPLSSRPQLLAEPVADEEDAAVADEADCWREEVWEKVVACDDRADAAAGSGSMTWRTGAWAMQPTSSNADSSEDSPKRLASSINLRGLPP
mmetsp:Transcript_54321/g.97934  ORF Transcript_54321/g.97934 Transcript_54321/m.97934 type:complete len:156 (-) Transcript_54321:603-1070(-)